MAMGCDDLKTGRISEKKMESHKPRKYRSQIRGIDFCLVAMAVAAWLFVFSGCSESSRDRNKPYLIKVGENTFSVIDFNRAFDVAKMSYSDKLSEDSLEFAQAKVDLLGELTEQLLLLERADELHLTVSDKQLQEALEEIKIDYPDQSFEKMLLEAAIPYSYWEESLRRRLLQEAVIEKDLESAMEVSPDEIARFYDSFFREETPESPPDSEKNGEDRRQEAKEGVDGENPDGKRREEDEPATIDAGELTEKIIRQLKREKARRIYPAYIEKLRKKYKIDINQAAWRRIVG